MVESLDGSRALSANSEYRTLLAVTEAVVSHRDLRALIHDLADLLRPVVRFDHLLLGLHDPATYTMRPYACTPRTWAVPERLGLRQRVELETAWATFVSRRIKGWRIKGYCTRGGR